MRRVESRLLADAILVGLLLFIGAGTRAWWEAWVLLAVMLFVRSLSAIAVYRVSPELLRERAGLPLHADQPFSDKVLLFGVVVFGFLGLPFLAGLDVFHLHLLPRPTPIVARLGLLLFALGWGLKGLALRANAFATTVLRMQHERGHAVAEHGVYGVVRHPFYAADPLIFAGMGLWLGSYATAASALLPVAFMVLRLQREELFLMRELPDYQAYTTRVQYRLIPGVW